MKKKAGKYIHPPFAGIILIRYTGIFSAIPPTGGCTPVNNFLQRKDIKDEPVFLKEL